MIDEKKIASEGDELAAICVESGMAFDQLRRIYKLVRVRPLLEIKSLEYIKAYVKRQMARVRGYLGFKRVLELIDKYECARKELGEILKFAVMLYGFHKEKPVLDLHEAAEPAIREIITQHGADYIGTKINLRGNLAFVDVKASYLHSNPGRVANLIQEALRLKQEFSDISLKIWINQVDQWPRR